MLSDWKRDIEREIERHPDTQAAYLEDALDEECPYLDLVEWLEPTEELEVCRKSEPIRWRGWRFKIRNDPKSYEVRLGSSWVVHELRFIDPQNPTPINLYEDPYHGVFVHDPPPAIEACTDRVEIKVALWLAWGLV